jgi:hypothetical protein
MRRSLIDKLVDYVIVWESILLTTGGKALTQELSYRFSLNGSSLLATACKIKDRRSLFIKMRFLYSLRSSLVHGGHDRSIEKKFKTGEFGSLEHACRFLETNFTAALWWLIEIAVENRPYKKEGGWEDLLWPKKSSDRN